MRSLLDTILDGFESVENKENEQALQLAAIVAEAEYQSCLMELQNDLT